MHRLQPITRSSPPCENLCRARIPETRRFRATTSAESTKVDIKAARCGLVPPTIAVESLQQSSDLRKSSLCSSVSVDPMEQSPRQVQTALALSETSISHDRARSASDAASPPLHWSVRADEEFSSPVQPPATRQDPSNPSMRLHEEEDRSARIVRNVVTSISDTIQDSLSKVRYAQHDLRTFKMPN